MGATARVLGASYASEISRAALASAFDALGMQAVVSCTVRHNVRSGAVMERIGMHYAGEFRSAAWLKELKESRTTRRSRCLCSCEESGTRPLRLLWSHEGGPEAGPALMLLARTPC